MASSPETPLMISSLSSVIESTQNTLTHSCRTVSPQVPSVLLSESVYEMYDAYESSVLWAAFLLAYRSLLTDLQHYSYHRYVPVYIAIVCPQVPGSADSTAATIYNFTLRGPAAGGSYSYPCGLPT